MNLNKEIRDIMDNQIMNLTGCFCLIYKTRRGSYRVHSLVNKTEKDEIKSIMMDKFVSVLEGEQHE